MMTSQHQNVTTVESDFSDLISARAHYVINVYLSGVATTLLAIFGVHTNIINFVIFLKQGIRDCVSVCLIALTFSDFCFSLMSLVYSLSFCAEIVNPDLTFDPGALEYMASWSRAFFYDISMATTAFISVERCLCVVMPFRFKNVFTLNRARMILTAIYIFTTTCYMPAFVSQGLTWKIDPHSNSTRLVLWLADYRATIEAFSNTFTHIILSTFIQLIVVISTYLMRNALHRSSQFLRSKSAHSALGGSQNAIQHRSSGLNADSTIRTDTLPNFADLPGVNLTSGNQMGSSPTDGPRFTKGMVSLSRKQNGFSSKNAAVSKMVFILTTIFIVCNSYRLGFLYARRIQPQLSPASDLHDIYHTSVGISGVMTLINASVNIFVYYFLRPSFRDIFHRMFCPRTS